jgi:hypothetical protein
MLRAVVAVTILAGACAPHATARILPASISQPLVAYEMDDRSLYAPAGGRLSSTSDDLMVQYEGGATLTVAAVPRNGVSLSEADIGRMLRGVHPSLRSAPLAKEESPEAALFCVENHPFAVCARINGEADIVVLSTFVATDPLYESLGGARLAAEAARTAKGMRPADALPPP